MAYRTACLAADIAIGEKKSVNVEGTKLIIYRLQDGFYATQSSCTHLFAPLTRGKIIDDCKVQCPFHRARFDIRSGAVVDWANFPPGVQLLNGLRGKKALKTYRVQIADGNVQVEL